MTATNRLAEKLGSGKLALTAACLPPHDGDPASVKKLAGCFPSSLDGVVVADNPNKLRGSALACAALLAGEKLEPMLSLITRDRNRIALESDVLGATALGIKSFLCLNGAHQTLGAGPQAAAAFDIDAVQLCQAMSRMTSQGLDFDGNKLPSAPKFGIAAAVHPFMKPVELAVLQAKKKIDAGAQLVLTDAVFDVSAFEVWMKAMRATKLDARAPIIASVLPLTSVAQAKALRSRSGFPPIGDDILARLEGGGPDVAATGIAIVGEIAAKLRSIQGVRGIHILSVGCEHLVPKIIQEARLA
jgi:methylenetetrahydrofolate reductase (NADPH)